MDLLEEIKRRLENETRDPATLFESLRSEGMKLFLTRQLNPEQVVSCCVALIAMYQKLEEQKTHLKNKGV